jgi:hypothetical protein
VNGVGSRNSEDVSVSDDELDEIVANVSTTDGRYT